MSYAQWSPTAFYLVGDVVLYLAVAYQAVANNTNQVPNVSPSWIVFGSGGGSLFAPAYNSFFSNTTQSLTAGIEMPITYDISSFSGTGVSLIGIAPTAQFSVNQSGVYRIVFSAQLDKTAGGGSSELDIYLRINGTNVANTGSKAEVAQTTELVITVSYIIPLSSTDIIELVAYTASGVGVVLLAVPANPPVPAIPSIITDIQRVA